jgi:hypothetical protein
LIQAYQRTVVRQDNMIIHVSDVESSILALGLMGKIAHQALARSIDDADDGSDGKLMKVF